MPETGTWQGPIVPFGGEPRRAFPTSAHVALHKQTDDILVAATLDREGALQIA